MEFYYIYVLNRLIIAADKLYIEQLRKFFEGTNAFETSDIFVFYSKREPQIKTTTVNWRIYKLVQIGTLKRIGRGKFLIGQSKIYIPEISAKIKSIHTKIIKEFPYLKLCIWDTSSFNEFMIHQPGRFYVLVEVAKETTQSVFYFLKENKFSVFVEPTKELIEKYIPYEKETIIVKSLVSEAPVQTINKIMVPTLEKMLVDIYCDDLIFAAQQGSEMRNIFQEGISKYSINENRMLRYADRRRKKDNFREYLNSFSNIRH